MNPSVVYLKEQKYEKIKKNLLEQKTLFCDNTFPTSNISLGSAAETLLESDHVEWKRPKDLCDSPKLFLDGASMIYITGGQLASFWFLQAVQILAGLKELLFKVMVDCGEQEWQHPEKYTGLFRFRFWRFGQWIEVVVDDYLPCLDGRLLFCQSREPGQFWPALLEKAYAKVLGSYGALEDVHISDVLVDLTGGVAEILDLKTFEDLTIDEDSRGHLYQSLATEMADHAIVCASIASNGSENMEQKTMEGLIRGRMYQLTALKKIHLADLKLRHLFKNREKVAVIRLRDTRGSQDNSAVCSPTKSISSSPEEDTGRTLNASQLTKMLSRNGAWSKLKDEDRGKFGLSQECSSEVWMPFEDFARYYHELIIVRLYNNNIFTTGRRWRDSALRGRWSEGDRGTSLDRCGGGDITSDNFLRNPQYLLDILNDEEEVVFQLLQWEGSEVTSPSKDDPPLKILPIGLTIFRVEVNRKYRLHRQWGFSPTVLQVDHQRRREIMHRGVLNKGRYIVIPSTLRPLSTGNFILRVITHHSVSLREATKDIPTELCGLSCIASPTLWVTVLTVKSAVGLPAGTKNVFCKAKCEKQTAKTGLSGEGKDITWQDSIIFYRRKPERSISLKVYRHNTLSRNTFLGMVELQARVNHAPTQLEVTLLDEKMNSLSDRTLTIEMLTEDDLMSV